MNHHYWVDSGNTITLHVHDPIYKSSFVFEIQNNQELWFTTSLDPPALKHLATTCLLRLSKPANTGVFPLHSH